MFGLLFASLCAANSYNVRFKCEMEYWFINSIYGEHNLQKFTNVFIKWNFIRWLFGLQSYFHTVPYSIEWMLLCVLQQSMLLQNYAFTPSIHPPKAGMTTPLNRSVAVQCAGVDAIRHFRICFGINCCRCNVVAFVWTVVVGVREYYDYY